MLDSPPGYPAPPQKNLAGSTTDSEYPPPFCFRVPRAKILSITTAIRNVKLSNVVIETFPGLF